MYLLFYRYLQVFTAALFVASTLSSATFSIIYPDNEGNAGFSSASSRDPVGGNNGSTLGQQRKNVLEKAAEIWGAYLESDVEIEIYASFEDGGGNSEGAVLASCGPDYFYEDFTNQPMPKVWYAAALANSLAGSDLEPQSVDMNLSINESVDSDPDVLGGDGFYYGYDNNPGEQVDLLATLLHEIGHGLGFISSISLTDGAFVLESLNQLPDEPNWPDSFSLLLKDMKTGKLWIDMTAEERIAAVAGTPNVVFTGACTEQACQHILKPERGQPGIQDSSGMLLTVSHLDEPVESYEGEAPEFGPGVPPWGLSGQIVLIDDGVDVTSDACEEPFANADDIIGCVALLDRSGRDSNCFFVDKVKRAESAGAIAAIVINNDGDDLFTMSFNEVYQEITIPSIFIGQTDGEAIKARLLEEKLQGTLSNQNELSGTQNNVINVDSESISHWSSEVFPGLLMEPSKERPVRPDADLTLTALRDIGWKTKHIPFPYISFESWADENVHSSDVNFNDDPDGDNFVNLLEYAFGTNPEDASSTPAPIVFSAYGNGKSSFTLQYKRNPSTADIIFHLNKSSDLTMPFTEVIHYDYKKLDQSIDEDGLENVSLQIDSLAERQFFKLEVEQYLQQSPQN